MGTQNGTSTLERGQRFLKKSNLHFPSDPTILLLGIYGKHCLPKKKEAMTMTRTSTFTAVSFAIAKNWEQLIHPPAGESMNTA